MIQNVIFDLDGVIRGIKNTPILDILSKDVKKKYFSQYKNEGLCDFVGRYLPMPIFKEWDKGLVSAQEVLDEMLKNTTEPHEVVGEVFYGALKIENNFIYHQTVDFIKTLKANNFKLFLLSNMCVEVVDTMPLILDFNLFDNMLFSYEVGLRKPDLEFYKKALKKFNISAKDSIFIDDNAKNLTPFESLGGKAFLFNPREIEKSLSELKNKIQFESKNFQ